MKFLIILILVSINANKAEASSRFINLCVSGRAPQEIKGLEDQIEWLKILFDTKECKVIEQKIKKLNSFSYIIPRKELNKSVESPFKPFEMYESRVPSFKLQEIDNKFKFAFEDLTLFRGFTNLKHIHYVRPKLSQRNLCYELSKLPSISSITLDAGKIKLSLEEIDCIKSRKINLFVMGEYKEELKELSNQIVGIENFEGEIKNLYKYHNLEYLGLLERKDHSNLKELMGIRKLQNLKINVRGVTDPENIGYLKNLNFLSINCNESITSYKPNRDCDKYRLRNIDFLSELIFLKGLDISQNDINDLSPISIAKNLEYLDASTNNIQTISNLKNSKSIKFLNIASNKVTDLHKLDSFKRLKALNITQNQILEFDSTLELDSLKYLSAGGNSSTSTWIKKDSLRILNLDPNYPSLISLKKQEAIQRKLIELEFDEAERVYTEKIIK